MGRVKEWIIEQDRLEEYGAKIEFKCPNPDCGSWIEHYSEIPYPDFMAEKQSDISQSEDIDIPCERCGTSYRACITNDSAFVSAGLLDFPDLMIEVDAPDQHEDYFDDYQPPDDPYSVAKEALSQLDAMVGLPSPPTDPQFTNRLLFAGAVSCFEAYLSDTLINAVKMHPTVLNQLLKANRKLGKLNFSAADLAKDPEIISKRTVATLKKVLFHDLRAVTELYKAAFGFPMMPSKHQRDILFPAMLLRHHCVHRNGQDQSGNKLDNFNEEYVRSAIGAIMDVIDHLQDRLNLELPF